MFKALVVDAQGGGLGASIVKSLKEKYADRIEIIALGTNAIATTTMHKAGANACATGENAICFNVRCADVILGGIGIIAANSMMGEISPSVANAVAESDAEKILIPISKCNILIPGTSVMNAKDMIEAATDSIAPLLERA